MVPPVDGSTHLLFQLEGFNRREPHESATNSSVVGPLDFDLRPGTTLTLGRHSETKTGLMRLGFKSKVVSRQHAEIWLGDKETVFIRDIGSSSGTFLNTKRLSQAHQVSEAYPVKDGDIIRIGTSYHEGISEHYRCVTFRVRLYHRPQWNCYNIEDCSICLYPVTPSQALFVTACSHIFHYKCCSTLLHQKQLKCPYCRTMNDLDSDVC